MIRPEIFPKNARIVPLGEVVEFLDNLRKPITASERKPGPYPYYGANGQQDSVADFIFDEPLVLLAEDGGFFGVEGKTIAYRIEGKSWVNNHAHVLRPRAAIDYGFLFRQLEQYDVRPWVNGTTRAKLTKSNASDIPIYLPPIAEQRRIAGILDKADAIRRKRQQALALTDDLLRSTFLDMFGDPVVNTKKWDVVKFGDVTTSRLGKMLDVKRNTGEHTKKYLANFNVQWDRFDLSDLREMDFSPDDQEVFRLIMGDLLVCEGGEVGRCAVWDESLSDVYYQKALHRVRCNPNQCTPEYLQKYLWFMAHGNGLTDVVVSATIPHLTGVKLKELRLPLPPYDLQTRFSEIVRDIKSLKLKLNLAHKESDNLFNSCLQRAFRGDL